MFLWLDCWIFSLSQEKTPANKVKYCVSGFGFPPPHLRNLIPNPERKVEKTDFQQTLLLWSSTSISKTTPTNHIGYIYESSLAEVPEKLKVWRGKSFFFFLGPFFPPTTNKYTKVKVENTKIRAKRKKGFHRSHPKFVRKGQQKWESRIQQYEKEMQYKTVCLISHTSGMKKCLAKRKR